MPGDDFGATKRLGGLFLFLLEGKRNVGIEALQANPFLPL